MSKKSKFVRLEDASTEQLDAAGLSVEFKMGNSPVSEATLQSAAESFRTREEEFAMLRAINGTIGPSRQFKKSTNKSDLDRMIKSALRSNR